MAARVPDGIGRNAFRSKLNMALFRPQADEADKADGFVRSIKCRRLSLGIQDSMEEFGSRVVICSTQSDYLLTKIQQRSSRILDALSDPNLALLESSRSWTNVFDCLEVFICNMMAAEDLLYLCAQEDDWKLAALSVFLPASFAPCHSRFALVARDLDYTYHMLLTLLEAEDTEQPYTLIGEALTDARNQDRAIVLHKLEGEPNKGSVHQEVYGYLLRKRFQRDASPSAPGSVPDWCWIPEKVKYEILDTVASGNFKSVLKCQWLGLDVAIAVYKGEYAKYDLEAEAGILASVQHPNVVSMFGCAYDDKKQEGYLVTELMEQDLRQLIRERVFKSGHDRSWRPFSESVARDIILQIVEAMIHIHKCRVLHRDLKPANCLVSRKKRRKKRIGETDEGKTYYVVKVIDFGASRLRGADASTCHTRKQGTTAYMAPEVHAMPKDCAYKWPADVYSFGMTMYEIFSMQSPFEGVYSGEQLATRVRAGERPWGRDPIPFKWEKLMETCCHRDPKRRPSFAWIRLEIMRGLPHFSPPRYEPGRIFPMASDSSLHVWQRNVEMPSEILEELLENSEGFTVETDPGVLAHIGRAFWNSVDKWIMYYSPFVDL